MSTDYLKHIPYQILIESFFCHFTNEFGVIKRNEVIEKVDNSKRAEIFLGDCAYNKMLYSAKSYIDVIQTGRRFLLASPETISFGALYLFEKWRVKIGENLGLSEESYLKKVFFQILEQGDGLKTHFNAGNNFFQRYYSFLNDFFEAEISNAKNIKTTQGSDESQYYIDKCAKLEKQIKDLEEDLNKNKKSLQISKRRLINTESVINKMLKYNGKTLYEIDECDDSLVDIERVSMTFKQGTTAEGLCFVYSNYRLFVRTDDSIDEEVFNDHSWKELKFHCIRKEENDEMEKYQLFLTS